MRILIASFILFVAAIAQAGEPRIVETETGVTVEYTGVPSPPDKINSEEKRKEPSVTDLLLEESERSIVKSRIELEIARNELELMRRKNEALVPPPVKHITIAKIQPDGYEVSGSGSYMTYRIKVELENTGPAYNVFLTLNGVDGTGQKVDSILINGIIAAGTTTTLRGSTYISSQQSANIRSWVVESANAYKK